MLRLTYPQRLRKHLQVRRHYVRQKQQTRHSVIAIKQRKLALLVEVYLLQIYP